MKLFLSMLVTFAALVSVPAGGGAARPVASPVTNPTSEFAGLVELTGGRSVYVQCAGTGGPTVLLISGYRSRADVWTDNLAGLSNQTMVYPALAETTRVCTYDRPGTMSVLDGVQFPSRSDSVPMPRSAEEEVAELRMVRLLIADDDPVVLVAHSLGGLFARLYASTYPDDVDGLVLVDAFSEYVEANMPEEEFSAYADYASVIPNILANYLDYETVDFVEASRAVRIAAESTPLPTIPYVVLSKGQPFGLQGETPGFAVETFEAAWDAAQAQLASLLPGAMHETVIDSGHYIQLQRPDVVIEAVNAVIEAVRSDAS